MLNKDDETNKHGHIRLSKEVLVIVVIGVCIIVIWLGLKFVLHVDNPFYVVSSESMVPTLMIGDLVVLRNGAEGFSFSDLQVGDIIVFHTEDGGGRIIVHRIVEIYQDDNTTKSSKGGTEKGDERLVKTKGDNNPISYEDFDYPISEADYYGKVISIIPKIGLVTMPPYNYIIAGIAVGLVTVVGIVGYVTYQKEKKTKIKNKE